jgi:hypothetical protein
LAENANIPVTTEKLWIPMELEIEHYMTDAEFKTIDANRHLAIGISQTEDDHAEFFIDDLQREIDSGQVKIVGKFKDPFIIVHVPPGTTIVQGGQIFQATFAHTFN